jgi:hypothetical protein
MLPVYAMVVKLHKSILLKTKLENGKCTAKYQQHKTAQQNPVFPFSGAGACAEEEFKLYWYFNRSIFFLFHTCHLLTP